MDISIGEVKVFTHKGSIEKGAEAINLLAASEMLNTGRLIQPLSVQYLTDRGETVIWYQYSATKI